MKKIKNMADLKSLKTPAVVRCYATWCGPCKEYSKTFGKVATTVKGVSFAEMDIGVAENVVEAAGLMSVPTTLFVKDGEITAKLEGAVSEKRLASWVEKQRGEA